MRTKAETEKRARNLSMRKNVSTETVERWSVRDEKKQIVEIWRFPNGDVHLSMHLRDNQEITVFTEADYEANVNTVKDSPDCGDYSAYRFSGEGARA